MGAIMEIAGWRTESVAERYAGATASVVTAGFNRSRNEHYAEPNASPFLAKLT